MDNKNIKKILYWTQKDQDFLNSLYAES
jgi:hypothetical protein